MSTSSVPKDSLSADARGKAPIRVPLVGGPTALIELLDAYLTLSSDQTAQAGESLRAPTVIPIHLEGRQHLTQEPGTIPDAFARRGLTDRLLTLSPGEIATVHLSPPAQA